MALVFCCGLECGVATTVTGHFRSGTGSPTIGYTTTKRSGDRSLRCNASGSAIAAAVTFSGANETRHVGRFYILFNGSLPSGDCSLHCTANVSTPDGPNLRFQASDSKLYAANDTTLGASGVTVTTGVWYRIDYDYNNNTGTADVRVDGTACGQATGVVVAGSGSQSYGVLGAVTADVLFDDIAISITAGDYPIGAGYVNHFVPTADGTHNIAGTGDFQRGNTATDILNATTTAFQLVDDVPLPSGAVSETDNIRCVAPANPTTDYVECIFGPAPGISTPTAGPRMVDVILAHHEIATQTGEMEVRLNDNGSFADIYNPGVIAGVVTYRYERAGFADPPSAASVWHANNDGSNGDFRDLRVRVLGIDAAPDQCLDAIMIEAEFAEVAATFIAKKPYMVGNQAMKRASYY